MILAGCSGIFAVSHILQIIAEWNGVVLNSPRLDTTLNVIGYIATAILGYLFGKAPDNQNQK
jgi:hypothetical protein